VDSLIEGIRITMSWKKGMSKEDWMLLMIPLVACVPANDTPVVHNTDKDARIAPFGKTFTAVHVTVIALAIPSAVAATLPS
jgi:hypothetical protein